MKNQPDTDAWLLTKSIAKEHVWPYRKKFLLAIFFMLIGAVSTTALPYLLQPIFDQVFAEKSLYWLVVVCVGVFTSFVLKGASGYGESVVMTYIGQKIISDIQNRLFKHLMKADLNFFHEISSGELLSRFSNDVTLMRTALANTIIGLGKDTFTLIFLVSLMFYRDTQLALIAFVVFPTAVLPIIKIGRRMRKATGKTQEQIGSFTNQLSQLFRSIRVVKAYGTEKFEMKRADKSINHIFKLIYKTNRVRAASHPIIETIAGIAIISVIAYGGMQVMHSDRTTGEFISFIAALLLSYEPLKRLSNLNSNVQEGLAAAQRVFTLLAIKPKIVSPTLPKPMNDSDCSLHFKDVGFHYPGHRKKVLKGMTFHAEAGQTIAFVGASGAGKSTIINLIPRFYDVSNGDIIIAGQNVKNISIDKLRGAIALVSQEIALFDLTIKENIAYGLVDATDEDIISAAKSAAAHEFIEKLPQGYETYIGENGLKLSGGQRQRIAIARALLKNAPFLLLDEATSALDSASERTVQKALKRLMKGRTTVVVAHRLSTIIDADQIFVLDNGEVCEKGTHEELLKKPNGAYSQLWKNQIDG